MIKRISTADGSDSLFVEELNETYHSKHGALRESQHVFIKEGLEYLPDFKEISILEVGMGTGLNVLLACELALQRQKKITFTTLEPFPISRDLVGSMNYTDLISAAEAPNWFKHIHEDNWGAPVSLHDWFDLTKHQVKLEAFNSSETYDLVFYDAFGPHAQPELWEAHIFEKIARLLKPNAVLVTYCAQGQFKRNLKSAGFSIERLPGPPGKREMTRATFLG